MISIIETVQKIKVFRNSIAHMDKANTRNDRIKSSLPSSSSINTMRKDLSKKYAPKPHRPMFRKMSMPSYPKRLL